MNPGNGIETRDFYRLSQGRKNFLLMNPGNGIETIWWMPSCDLIALFPINESRQRDWNFFLWFAQNQLDSRQFPINESRQRDWNRPWEKYSTLRGTFPINESRQRDWNGSYKVGELITKRDFLLMNPGNGIETF